MFIRRLVGNSMTPTLKNGQVIIARRKKYNTGDVVIAKAGGIEVIKRIISVKPKIVLMGDNINSAKYDDIKESDILGVLIWPKIKT